MKYRGWAIYAACKAAMNNFAQSLGSEEPDIVSVAIQPGMVNTEMQTELREVHGTALDAEMHSKFTQAHASGMLLEPETPGHVMARVVLDAPKELSGEFFRYVLHLLHTRRDDANEIQVECRTIEGFPGIDLIFVR